MSFIVWRDGTIREVKVKRGIGGGCDEEAVRVVKSMPVWNPGLQRNISVNVECVLPVKFKLN
ncbi:MAG: energy transducer TonB [Bacteroidetes bacterium]|nr:energy transducer TonB [Bacteroidota bacterium]MBL7105271.1 energy transducer TonB [Bacteroidales bacterium]